MQSVAKFWLNSTTTRAWKEVEEEEEEAGEKENYDQ